MFPAAAHARSASTPLLGLAIALTLAAGCTEPNPSFVEPEKCAAGEYLYQQSFAATHPDRLDVLFVVDDTREAGAARYALRESAAEIIGALGDMDYRVGVTTTDGSGQLHNPSAACPSEGYASPDQPSPVESLTCLLNVAEGPLTPPAGIQSILNAVRSDVNANFIRPDARLLVIVVSVYDDCSSNGLIRGPNLDNCEWQQGALTPIVGEGGLARPLISVKQDGNATALAVIVGPNDGQVFPVNTEPEPSCSGVNGTALHGTRYRELADTMGVWGFAESICSGELAAPVVAAIQQLGYSSEARYCLGKAAPNGVREVELIQGDAETGTMLTSNSDAGYAFIGTSRECGNGLVALSEEARVSVRGNSHVQILFCGP